MTHFTRLRGIPKIFLGNFCFSVIARHSTTENIREVEGRRVPGFDDSSPVDDDASDGEIVRGNLRANKGRRAFLPIADP